jgi:chitodextrinase
MCPRLYAREGPRARVAPRSLLVISACAAVLALAACDRRETPAQLPATSPVATPAAAPAPAEPDTAPPTQPQNLEATGSPEAATLAWTGSGDDVGVEGYEVLRGEERVARVAIPQARVTGLRAGERYCYSVVAFDAAGNRSQPSATACVVVPDVTPPTPPAALAAALASPAEVKLEWAASTDDVAVAGYEILRGDEVVGTAREPRARLSGLRPGRRHCFSVRALDAAGNRSGRVEPACVAVPDVTPPTAPSGLALQARPGRVDLRWEPASDDVGVAGYEVLRDGAVVARSAHASAAESGLSPARRYCYSVLALDAAGNRSPPSGQACDAPPDVTPPTVPAGVAARSSAETELALRWDPATDDVGVDRYEVMSGDTVVAKVARAEAKVSGLRPAVQYCHSVRACDAAGNCSPSSAPACVTTPDLTPPTRVAEVSAQPESDRRIAVTWKEAHDNVGVVRYEVRRDGRKVGETDGTATRLEEEGLSPATRYCYAVVAEDAARNASPPSAPACATTPDLVPPSVPGTFAAAARSSTDVMARWEASTDDVGVAGYEVMRDGAVAGTFEGTHAIVPGFAPATEICLSVRAFDAAGNRSRPSAAACTRTGAPGTPAAPSDLRAHVTPEGDLLLTWERTPDAGLVYSVYWEGRKGDRRIGTTPTNSFKVFGKAAAERHCYRVVAVDEATERSSPPTFPACAAVPGARTPAPAPSVRTSAAARAGADPR